MEALERMPFTAQKKIFKRLAELADSRCLSQEEQEKYDESLKAADDYYGVLMSYYMNGIDEGVAKGFAKVLPRALPKVKQEVLRKVKPKVAITKVLI